MKILLLGRFGKVGTAIKKVLANNSKYELHSFSRRTQSNKEKWDSSCIDLNILDFNKLLKQIHSLKPDIIINSAAYTNVDDSEINKDLCFQLNTKLPEILLSAVQDINCRLIHLSTDYIFDGESGPYAEDAAPNPINYYGFTKNEGEKALLSYNYDKLAIVRTNFLYSTVDLEIGTFINNSILKMIKGDNIAAVNSLWTTPVTTEDIALGIKEIIKQDYRGIINFSGPDYLNRYEIAKIIASTFDFPEKLINKVNIEEINFIAKRPIKAGLQNYKAQNELKCTFRSLQEGLKIIKNQLQ
ncbi:MAG: SDR family oxidoreductase [Candidatus Kapaibacteriota bacterium]